MNKASHLIDEPSIAISPTLARILGINKAAMLQQLHFLLNSTKVSNNRFNYVDGRWWVYNSYPEWQRDHFVWLGESTIKRLFCELEEVGIVLSRQSVKHASDRRKWYTIDYEAWERFVAEIPSAQNEPTIGSKESDGTSAQNEPTIGSKESDGTSAQNEPTIGSKESDGYSETPTKTPAKNTSKAAAGGISSSPPDENFELEVSEIVQACNHHAIKLPVNARKRVGKAIKDYGFERVSEAVKRAAGKAEHWNYITPMLEDWKANGKPGDTPPKRSILNADGMKYINGKYAALIEH